MLGCRKRQLHEMQEWCKAGAHPRHRDELGRRQGSWCGDDDCSLLDWYMTLILGSFGSRCRKCTQNERRNMTRKYGINIHMVRVDSHHIESINQIRILRNTYFVAMCNFYATQHSPFIFQEDNIDIYEFGGKYLMLNLFTSVLSRVVHLQLCEPYLHFIQRVRPLPALMPPSILRSIPVT